MHSLPAREEPSRAVDATRTVTTQCEREEPAFMAVALTARAARPAVIAATISSSPPTDSSVAPSTYMPPPPPGSCLTARSPAEVAPPRASRSRTRSQ